MYAKARCNTCGKQFLLDFGCMPKDDAIQRHEEMKKQGIYCRAHREDSIRQWSADQSEKPKTG
jgi:hypothetical protein